MAIDSVVSDPTPLARRRAWRAIGRCSVTTVSLVARGRLRQPRHRVGWRVHFADGTSACVFRETEVRGAEPIAPCLLVVAFKLRGVHREGLHAVFRASSVCNTLLFGGFAGLRTKLWLDHDEIGRYRGLYQWDGPSSAVAYVRALHRALALASPRDAIHAVVLPSVVLDDVLADPDTLPVTGLGSGWWRVCRVERLEPPAR